MSVGLQWWWGTNINKFLGDRGKGIGGLPLIVVVLCILVVSIVSSDFVRATLIELGFSLVMKKGTVYYTCACTHMYSHKHTLYPIAHTH